MTTGFLAGRGEGRATEIVVSQFRIPVEIDTWLKQEARRSLRSKNAQLVAFLRRLMEDGSNGDRS